MTVSAPIEDNVDGRGRQFKYPAFYNFPPFFTIQPNAATREMQTELWMQLVTTYYRHHTLYFVEFTDSTTGRPPFCNGQLPRQLSLDGLQHVCRALLSTGRACWVDTQGKEYPVKRDTTRLLVLWRSKDKWAGHIYEWARSTGQIGRICTVMSLIRGDDTANTVFHGAPVEVVMLGLRSLEQNGLAEVFSGNVAENTGVKFFSP
eukprot:Lankesteria_metandrocarpae@DN2793_c0_g1_i1.p1